ncbi:MAG: DedA family protein [Desulfarculales bacterium]|jgi:membrane-associated protein|nr:DedA family protein [Desulfarculales bacterium]
MEAADGFFPSIWNFILAAWDFFLHLDLRLEEIIKTYGLSAYIIIFLVVFCETGLVVTPFLPGDSLLFALGSFAALGIVSLPWILLGILFLAAVLGDTLNYWVGNKLGSHLLARRSRFINPRHLARTHEFFERYGGKTIIIARFIPIVRTFAPFVAGIGAMTYRRFLIFNLSGAALWVGGVGGAGYLFGNIEIIKQNFSLVILAIIIISVLPGIIEFARLRHAGKKN